MPDRHHRNRHPLISPLLPSALLAASLLIPAESPLAQAAKAPAAKTAPAAPSAPGEPLPPVVAAIIDYNKVMRESKAAKGIRDQIETRRKLYQDQIAKEEQKLDGVQKELAKQRGVLSTEAFGKKRDDFQKQVLGVQRMVQERRRQLDQVSAAAYNQVKSAMVQIATDLSTVRGFNVVLPSSTVLLYSPQIDLTDEVIRRVDAKLPSVKVPEKVTQ
jgi:Skp family chaperone for outer membrane proteins